MTEAAGHAAPAWVAVDWGTSNLRLWALDAAGGVIAERRSDRGMNTLDGAAAFEAALLEALAGLLPASGRVPVVICGMAGARQGWCEAPYAGVPAPPVSGRGVHPATADPRLDVTILPGLCQVAPPDVMRGEETQIAGLLADEPEFSGTVCLPGTHSKWVEIAAGQVTRFATCMSGEIFALIAERSILRHGLGAEGSEAAFLRMVSEVVARPETAPLHLFPIRAEGLLSGLDPAEASGRLSGAIIGAELAATRDYWQGRPVVLLGSAALVARYHAALIHLGAEARITDGAGLTLAGLRRARELLGDET